ncbi:MAG: DUF1732 domain-containing protein, partial [Ignavibacteria bacterium]|nr:DUF1732 domain-containing protein [Ignavibacteria bacterium]
MILSMTGYGKSVASFNGFSFEVELKSVNNRFLEVSTKLPGSLFAKEFEIKELIRSKIKRGKISLSISVKFGAGQDALINEAKLIETAQMLKQIKKSLDIKEEIQLAHFLNFKELFSPDFLEFSDEHFEVLKKCISEAVDNLIEMRKIEGKSLLKDLLERAVVITETLAEIEKIHRDSVNEYFQKLQDRVQQIIKDIQNYSDRLEFELALLTEKSDITEECVRLKSHLKYFSEVLTAGDEAGRKLNFI